MKKEFPTTLLDALLGTGPSPERVLSEIRRDRRRRRTTKLMICTVALCFGAGAIALSSRKQMSSGQARTRELAMRSATVAKMPVELKPKSTDSETQALEEVLDGTPFAVMHWPNG